MPKQFRMWTTVVSWHDGDTYLGVLDQGFWTYRGTDSRPVLIRCALIQAPELQVDGRPNPLGVAARDFATVTAPPGEYPCWAYKPSPENYGRPLVDLLLPDGLVFSTKMMGGGYATRYHG